MEKEEFKVLVKGMKAVYVQPTFLPDRDAFNVWYSLLRDLEYSVCNAAIQAYMLQNKFPPTIADIRQMAIEVQVGEVQTWEDGWNKVTKAIKTIGMYRPEEAKATFDPITRQVVDRLGFTDLCTSENPMSDRANFRDIYNQIVERKKKDAQMPASLKLTMQGIRESIAQKQRESLPEK